MTAREAMRNAPVANAIARLRSLFGAEQNSNSPALQKERAKRLIFCISSGRAGSEYLMRLLATARGVTAFHERPPKMASEYLPVVMEKSLAATKEMRMLKVNAIREVLSQLPPAGIYAETNHMFIKTFYDVVMEAFPHECVTVVILRRNLAKVLKSFVNLGYFSDGNEACPNWMHRVPSSISLITPPAPFDEMDQYDRAISYLIDIEAHAQAFKQKYPACQIHEVFLEDLQSAAAVERFFQAINLEPTAQTNQAIGLRINDRQIKKDLRNIETTEEYCRERISNYLVRCRECGLHLPCLPQFKDTG